MTVLVTLEATSGWSHLKKLVEPSRHTPKWLLPHLAHAGVLVPLCALLPCECTGALADDGAGLKLTLEPVKLGGFIFKKLMNSRSISHFLMILSLLPNLVGQNLSQHPNSLTQLNIGDLFLRLHFLCIRYPLFLWFNLPSSRTTSGSSSWRHDLKDPRKHE
uniref:Gag-pol polyprotein n=1 Tax=Solanum tuberosum TaxID=4113 RepID=M1DH49_SOLTU